MIRKFGMSRGFEKSTEFRNTGRTHETIQLKEVRVSDPAYIKKLATLESMIPEERKKVVNGVPYLPFDQSVSLCEEFQPINKQDKEPYNPTHPHVELLRDLRIEVIDALEEQLGRSLSESEADSIKIYSAVGTPLDVFHGADAFFDIQKGNLIIRIDLSLRHKKSPKAEVLVSGEIPDAVQETDEYLDKIGEIAQETIHHIPVETFQHLN